MGKQLEKIPKEYRALLRQFYLEGRKDGRKEALEDTPFHRTEKRLYSLPELRERVRIAKDDIEELNENGLHYRSRDVMLIQTGSVPEDEEDRVKALVLKHNKDIESDEREIRAIEAALATIKNDEYYLAVEGHYIARPKMNDEEIAEQMGIKATTSIYRSRIRLVNRLTVIFYGSGATQ